MRCSSLFLNPIAAKSLSISCFIPGITSMGCKKTRTKMNKGVDAQLSFLKCRSGASKAVNEVQTLCVAETLLVMLSLGGSQSSLCHLCVEAIMKRLADPESSDFDKHLAEHEATLDNLKKQYCDILKELEAQKLRGKELEELEKVTYGKSLLDAPIDDLNVQELEILQKSMGEVKENLLKQIEKLSVHSESPTSSSSASFAGVVNPSVTNQARGYSYADIDDLDDAMDINCPKSKSGERVWIWYLFVSLLGLICMFVVTLFAYWIA